MLFNFLALFIVQICAYWSNNMASKWHTRLCEVQGLRFCTHCEVRKEFYAEDIGCYAVFTREQSTE